MAKKKEELKVESLEEEVQELKRSILNIFEAFVPPKEVRDEVLKNLYTIELSFLKIFKTLLDYKVESLEKKVEGKGTKRKAKKIEIE
ncbi:hypothetical protein [Hydrogenivirga sp. 128-5-R1-1]|uniref:hypothetical protein n=1 Tax=Hydrogenivirga sp. 128-5-R1-1 TaxID=392423 RepID=UPI00015F36D3|nr:hypothetical protein [Hydrogenivirga sp. 128-5-R1-1]EDP74574.1 hypothetical protein HG1285_12717 [Hydrogenivirga sp. 128-5-R1-1]